MTVRVLTYVYLLAFLRTIKYDPIHRGPRQTLSYRHVCSRTQTQHDIALAQTSISSRSTAPLFEPANFQRDGWGTIFSQGSRPNYQSSIQPLTYQENPGWIYGEGCTGGEACDYERRRNHENFLGAAYRDLSEFTERERPVTLCLLRSGLMLLSSRFCFC